MVRINDLSREIANSLATYTADVREEVTKATDDVTKEGVKRIKQNVIAAKFVLTGDYEKGWGRVKTDKGYVIRNKTDYQLTHLLEIGHAKRGGGRVGGKAHIRPVEDWAVKEYERRVEKAVRG